MNTSNQNLITLKDYSDSKPYVNSTGTEVDFEVEYDDKLMNVTVEMSWCGKYDELEIKSTQSECYDEEGNIVNTPNFDMIALVVEVFEKYNTFSKVEMAMEESYHADHRG